MAKAELLSYFDETRKHVMRVYLDAVETAIASNLVIHGSCVHMIEDRGSLACTLVFSDGFQTRVHVKLVLGTGDG